MHAERLCHRWLSKVLPEMHRKRLLALSAIVCGALRGGRLSVTSLGRSLRGDAKAKHNIKRADRLFSNPHLYTARKSIYKQLSGELLGGSKQPVILIDWSDVDARRKFYLLRAAVAVKGRSLTLYEEVHSVSTKEKPKTHRQFLRNLKEVIPEDCSPIVITDAGFRVPWFRQVLDLEWDYIGRVRNRDMVQMAQNTRWIGAKTLYAQAMNKAKLFSDVALTRSNTLLCSLVLFKAKPKGRKHLGKMGKKSRRRTSLVSSARAREPWLLATSLPVESRFAKKIVDLYSTRMQIEESFRDLKCPRYGLSLYHNGTYKIQRMRVLVLIGSIATNFAWILGKTARECRAHWQYQANTTKTVSVLSNVFIGIQVFRDPRFRVPWDTFNGVKKHLETFHNLQTMTLAKA